MPTPPTPPLMPDIEAAVIAWLGAKSDLAPPVLVRTKLPNTYDGSQKVVRVNRSGGFSNNSIPFWKDNVRLDVATYGPTKADAWDLNALVRRYILHSLKWETGPLAAYNAQVMDTTEYVGPQWLDSKSYPPAGRYLLQVGISIHPY